MNQLTSLLAKYMLVSLFANQVTHNDYCYTTDKDRDQRKHFSLQTKHIPYLKEATRTNLSSGNISVCFFLNIFTFYIGFVKCYCLQIVQLKKFG